MNRYIVFTPRYRERMRDLSTMSKNALSERRVKLAWTLPSVAFFEHSSKSAQHTPHSATLCAALFVIR